MNRSTSELVRGILMKFGSKSVKQKEKSTHALSSWVGSRDKQTGTSVKRDALARRFVEHMNYSPSEFQYFSELGGSGPAYVRSGSVRWLHPWFHPDPESKLYHPKGIRGNILVDPGRHPITLAHEVMHATPETSAEKALATGRQIAGLPIPAGLAGIAWALRRRAPRFSRGLSSGAISLGALDLASLIGEEMRATYKGRRVLQELGVSVPEHEFNDIRNIGLLTYVPVMGVNHLGIPIYLRSRMLSRLHL